MGFVDRDPEPEEMERLKDLLERELKAGAFGMSLGLIYPPSAFCKSEELVELVSRSFTCSEQLLIDKDLRGW